MKEKCILVTGINGFVGHYLAKELHSKGLQVIGAGSQPEAARDIQPLLAQYYGCDLTKEDSVAKLDLTKVDVVIHLAGLAAQGKSFQETHRTISDNSAMIINLFERALQQNNKPRFINISSGTVYDSDQPMPLTEESQTAANSPYAISKTLNEQLCAYYHKRGFECITVRPFNHTGPGQGLGYLISDLTKNIAQAGDHGTVKTGNLEPQRDYSDVRDIVRVYSAIATAKSVPHTLYNACSGKSRAGKEIFALISKELYGSPTAVTPEVDPQKLRPNDPAIVQASCQRLKEDFGWAPQYTIEQTIHDYVEWFRNTKPF
jgi:GDP-4-dehydro-6-deoxy-D-mannose reductase